MRFVSKANAAPLSIRRAEPEFLHIGVPRAFARVHARSAQLRPKLLQEPRQDEKLILHVVVQGIKLRFELLADFDRPRHLFSMTCTPYGSQIMYLLSQGSIAGLVDPSTVRGIRRTSTVENGMATAHNHPRKVLMLGVDAGDIHLIRSAAGKLPRLQQLLAEGPLFRLESTAETLSSTVWPTFSSSAMPGHHGIYYPMQWDAAAMTLRRVSVDWISYEPFWYELARLGKKITAFDVPFTLPSSLKTGVEVQNWGSQECLGPFGGNVSEIAGEIRKRFGMHPMGEDIPLEEPTAKLDAIRRNLAAGARRKAEAARWLMSKTEWDLFITVFAECHRGSHVLWPDAGPRSAVIPPNALADVYRAVDEAIGHVLDGADPVTTTCIVFSLHGARTNFTQEHFVLPMMERINASFEREPVAVAAAAPASAGKFNPMRMLREALPPQLQYTIARAVPAAGRDWVVRRTFCGGLDWPQTPGFALPASGEGYLRLNLAGREAQGALEPGSDRHRCYEAWLKDNLLSFTDAATGAQIVRDLVFMRDLYPGPRCGYLPDAVILWNEVLPATEIYSERLGRLAGKLTTGRTGEHQPEGFAIIAGNRAGVEQAPPLEHIADFAPFVRHLLG